MKDLRLLPIVLFALGSLLVLKVNDLMDHVGLEVAGPAPAFAEPGGKAVAPVLPSVLSIDINEPALKLDITGSTGTKDAAAEPPATTDAAKPAVKTVAEGDNPAAADGAAAAKPETTPAIKPVQSADPLPADTSASQAERALLVRLQQRREQLDQQARDLDTRENLLRATEKRIQDRIAELKQMEAGVQVAQEKGAEADVAKVKTLVIMYETMKPKDAARIFNKLDLPILVDVSSAMKPAKLADVLAAMDENVAKRLTVALAEKFAPKSSVAPTDQPALDLPKIEGQPAKN
jgi:flagellar motility protein MotE (MotC chaperone)